MHTFISTEEIVETRETEVDLRPGDRFKFTGNSARCNTEGEELMAVKVVGPGTFKFSSAEVRLAWVYLEGVNAGRIFSFHSDRPESIEITHLADYTGC